MSVIADKLQLTLATKENIKKAIEKKGITVGDAPFSDYPSKINSIGSSSDWKESDWHDIINIRLLDTEDYQYKSIYLLDDYVNSIILQGGDAYKTSDSDELIFEDGEYTFTGEGDLECSKGYKTRWVIVYKNGINNNQPIGLNSSLLYTIQDGIDSFTSFEKCQKLYYVDCINEIFQIPDKCFYKCEQLRNISCLNAVTSIGEAAFAGCENLSYLTISNCTIKSDAFVHAYINELTLYNCTWSYDAFVHSYINKLNLKSIKNANIGYTKILNIDDDSDVNGVNIVDILNYYHDKDSSSASTAIATDSPVFIEYPTTVELSSTYAKNTDLLGFAEIIDSTELGAVLYKDNTYLKKLTLTGQNSANSYGVDGFSVGDGCTALQELNIVNCEYVSDLRNMPLLSILNLPNAKHIGYSKTGYGSYGHGAVWSDLHGLNECELENLETMKISQFRNMYELTTLNFPKLQSTEIALYPASSADSHKYSLVQDCPNLEIINMPNLETITINRGYDRTVYVYIFYNIQAKQVNLNNLTEISVTLKGSSYNNAYLFSFVTQLTNLSLPKLTSIKTHNATSSTYGQVFSNMPDLITLDLPNLVTIFNNYMFDDLPNLETLNVPKLETIGMGFLRKNKKIKNFTIKSHCNISKASYMFDESNIENIIFEDGYNSQYSSSQLLPPCLQNCSRLKYIYLPSSITYADGTSTSITRFATKCPVLTTIELGQGYSKTLYLKHITTLTKECVVNMLNALADLTGQTKQTLYIYSTTLNLLSAEEKAIATNKNWTLSS